MKLYIKDVRNANDGYVEIQNVQFRSFIADTKLYGTVFFAKTALTDPTWVILSEKLPKGIDTVTKSFSVKNIREAFLDEIFVHRASSPPLISITNQ